MDIVDQLRAFRYLTPGGEMRQPKVVRDAAFEIEALRVNAAALAALRAATGELPPALVAKCMEYARDCCRWDTDFDHGETVVLRAATFEVVEK